MVGVQALACRNKLKFELQRQAGSPTCCFGRLILHRLARAAAINWNHVVGKTLAL
jgi:hypothetical protein